MECGTRIISGPDFCEIDVPEALFELKISKSILKNGARDAAERFLTIIPVDGPMQPGDIVAVKYPDDSAEGGAAEAHFSAGRGFFQADAERALLGAMVGETRRISLWGSVMPVTVTSIKRRSVPEFTDEIVKRLGIEGVSTVAEYEKHLIDRRAERLRRDREETITEYVAKHVVERSEFTPVSRTEGVCAVTVNLCIAQARNEAEQANADRSGAPVTELDILREIASKPVTASEEEVREAIAVKCEYNAKLCALGMAAAAREGVEFSIKDCEAVLRAQAESAGRTYEEFISATGTSPELIAADKYISFYMDQIAPYYQNRFHVTVTD